MSVGRLLVPSFVRLFVQFSFTSFVLAFVFTKLNYCLYFVGGNLGNLYAGSQFTVSYVRHLKSENHDFSFISNSSMILVFVFAVVIVVVVLFLVVDIVDVCVERAYYDVYLNI